MFPSDAVNHSPTSQSTPFSFIRYLAAKKSLDDRALNQHVFRTLKERLPQTSLDSPLRVFEVGCGIGTMIERLLDWKLCEWMDYTALDSEKENIDYAIQHFPVWAAEKKLFCNQLTHDSFLVVQPSGQVKVQFVTAEILDFSRKNHQTWDILVANAFLDLLDISSALPVLFELLKSEGVFYLTINFDGMTTFEPVIDPVLDTQIERLYHLTMDTRQVNGRPSGDSRAGKHLFTHIQSAGGVILDAGASDWVVYPSPSGYLDDEAYFLHCILHFVEQSLHGSPELDPQRFADWLLTRHEQIDQNRLVYIAHQIDFLGLKNAI
jgi:SAM-dependent methyltransferase